MRIVQFGPVVLVLVLLAGTGCGPTSPSKPIYAARAQPTARVPLASAAVEPRPEPKSEAKPPETERPAVISDGVGTKPPEEEEKDPEPESPPTIPKGAFPVNKNKTIWIEGIKAGPRKVHILAEVCLREGPLEVFLCKSRTKEHESILAADFDARELHLALITAGGKAGSPVQFFNQKTMKEEFKPASGSKIRITLTYNLGGKPMTSLAQEWIRDVRTKTDMPYEWVFAGSRLFKNPDDPNAPDYYCANNGEIISISNFIDAMLDLPVKSPRESAALAFESNPKNIPSRGTKVLVTLEVVPPK